MANELDGGYEEIAPPPPPRTFEIGLVMAGAISAGTYAAGVIDYLIEALDAWEDAKDEAKEKPEAAALVPQHKVVIKVVTAASAGSMNGAILAVAAGKEFPHVGSKEMGKEGYARVDTTAQERMRAIGAQNPFYKAWVLDISMDRLLGTNDLDGDDSVFQSLLDSTPITQITRECLRFQGLGLRNRSCFASPTRFMFTVGNLRGIPYFMELTGQPGIGLGMSSHRDYRSFSISYSVGASGKKIRADDIALVPPAPGADVSPDWKILGITAIASGAFPLGLAPRPMTRPVEDYKYRYVVVPGCEHDHSAMPPGSNSSLLELGKVIALQPNKDRLGEGPYTTFLVDGGTMNNEPLGLARTELAGLLGRNIRSGDKANRAIVMIDPFPDAEAQGNEPLAGTSPAIVSVCAGLMGAWKNQSRFSPDDLALAADDKVYSRFLIAPSRGKPQLTDRPGQPDLACGAFSGFSGFFHLDYRHHDYLLGRRNAQKFLSDVFTLPATNPLFGTVEEREKLGMKWVRKDAHGVGHLPIIPLMDDLLPAKLSQGLTDGRMEEMCAWPAGLFEVSSLEGAIRHRVDKIMSHAIENSTMHWARRLLARGLGALLKGHVNKLLLNFIHDRLAEGQLIEGRKAHGGSKGVPPPKTPDWFALPPRDL